MFDHVMINAADRPASERFYRTVLTTLGIGLLRSDARSAEWNCFGVSQASDGSPPTRRLHIGFAAPSREHVDEFWRTGTAEGYQDDGPPGPRPQYSPAYYGSFLLDPDGNSAEAVHDETTRPGAVIDHLWIRVADLAASKRFYEGLAPRASFRLVADLPDRVRFSSSHGSLSVVNGRPTENVHLALRGTEESAQLSDPDGNSIELIGGAS